LRGFRVVECHFAPNNPWIFAYRRLCAEGWGRPPKLEVPPVSEERAAAKTGGFWAPISESERREKLPGKSQAVSESGMRRKLHASSVLKIAPSKTDDYSGRSHVSDSSKQMDQPLANSPPASVWWAMAGGRRPFAQIDTHSWGERLRPPAHLGEAERRAFIDLVSSCPLAQFQPPDLPLLARWCELEVQAQTAAAELRENGMVISGKTGPQQSPWLAIHAMAVKGQTALALRLRLGPQSRANKAPKTQAAPMSAYERLAMMGDDDEDEAEAQPS
jgi:phage terminase small subunit